MDLWTRSWTQLCGKVFGIQSRPKKSKVELSVGKIQIWPGTSKQFLGIGQNKTDFHLNLTPTLEFVDPRETSNYAAAVRRSLINV